MSLATNCPANLEQIAESSIEDFVKLYLKCVLSSEENVKTEEKPSPKKHPGYVKIIGATPKALDMLRMYKRSEEGITVLESCPAYEDPRIPSNYPTIEVPEENPIPLEHSGNSASKQKKKRKRNRNNKKSVEEVPREPSDTTEDMSVTNSEHLNDERDEISSLKTEQDDTLIEIMIKETPSLMMGFKKQIAVEIASSVQKISSWDELKSLCEKVLPEDPLLKNACSDDQCRNPFELCKSILRYAQMYKTFIAQATKAMICLQRNVLLNAYEENFDVIRNLRDSHEAKMTVVQNRAQRAELLIDSLEKEVKLYQQLSDSQTVQLLSFEEDFGKLKEDQAVKEKAIKAYEKVKKSLLAEKNKLQSDMKSLLEEIQSLKNAMSECQQENDRLKAKIRRADEVHEGTEYRLKELENQHYDDRNEKEILREKNKTLTTRVDDLLGENASLRSQLEKLREANRKEKAILFEHKNCQTPVNSKKGPSSKSPDLRLLEGKTTTESPVPIGTPRLFSHLHKAETLTPDTKLLSDSSFTPGEEFVPCGPLRDSDLGAFSKTVRKAEPTGGTDGIRTDPHGIELSYNPWGPWNFNLPQTVFDNNNSFFKSPVDHLDKLPSGLLDESDSVENPKKQPVRRSLDFSSLNQPL